MTKITRRGIFGLAGGAVGLAACATTEGATPLPVLAGTASFEHGVASGDPTQTGIILWTRVTPATPSGPVVVQWEVFEEGRPSTAVQTGRFTTDASRDYTVKVDIGGLSPATEYAYKFTLVGADGVVVSPVGRTRTLAASGTTPVRAAVVSCSNFPFGYFHVYDAISKLDDLDVVIHLGDYLYEYGPDGYGGNTGAAIGRMHEPAREITTLADYRTRHAQYKREATLQAAHAAAPWICTWDDHESANNSYRTGAENHQSETEGNWTDRKQMAVQAYLEWMPVRDPAPGAARQALWRTFEFGDLASIICLETRLTGRSDEIAWGAELAGVAPEDFEAKVRDVVTRVNDPERQMLGAEQERWLDGALKSSTRAGKAWQVLANQIIMAEVRPPKFGEVLSQTQKDGLEDPRIKALVDFSALGQPLNLDAWDGYPAARERLYQSANAAGANLVTLTGDTHTGWANTLVDAGGDPRGVEFGCTSVTSPGFATYMPGIDNLGQMFADENAQVTWHDPGGSGYTLLELSAEAAKADFYKVSDVTKPDYTITKVATFRAPQAKRGTLETL